ncbi:MAG: GNAT family N-acetyltransferase [Elusimicrobiales bacterium]|nr:GNAT family N-acetyltransferase [Elusimicrobiales bacterium]
MEFEIGPAAAADIGALAGIEARCAHAADWGRGGLEAELGKPSARIFTARTGGRAAGFICANFIPPEAQVLNMAVAPEYARLGAGTALVEAVFAAARGLGCSLATLEVNEINAPAIALYSKMGFNIVGRRAKFYNYRHDALLMDKRLTGK